MKKIFFLVQILAILVFSGSIGRGQIVINSGPEVTPEEMVENIVGDGIQFSNVQFNGANAARGIFTNGSSTNLGMESGIFLTTGAGYVIPGPNQSPSAGVSNGLPGPPPWGNYFDPAILDFDFIPDSDTLRLKYVFGSEEYNEWVNSSFNDVFFLFISGPNPNGGQYENKNIAIVPGTTNTSIKVNNVNNGWSAPGVIPTGPCMNCQYYNDNTGGLTLEYDGFTVVLIAWLLVIPCETYHAQFGVLDAGDGILDTGVFIEENSFRSPLKITLTTLLDPAGLTEDMVEGHVEADLVFKLPGAEYAPVTICYEITGTASNGDDYEFIDNCVTFGEGEDSASFHIVPLQDGNIEGDETIVLIIENTFGCVVKDDTIELIIKDYVEMVTFITPNTIICEGQEVEISAGINPNWVTGYPPYTFLWEPGGFTEDSITVSPEETTMYIATITDLFQEMVQDSVLVSVSPICELENFYFEETLNPGLPGNVYGEVTNDTVFVVFPAGTNLNALIPSFTFDDEACTDSVGTVSDFTNPVVYEFMGPGGCSSQWIVIAEIETGMSDNVTDDIILIPNPSTGKFYFETKNTGSNLIELQVMDLTGRIVYERQPAISENFEIDLSGQLKGMYFMYFKTEDENYTQKLILQ